MNACKGSVGGLHTSEVSRRASRGGNLFGCKNIRHTASNLSFRSLLKISVLHKRVLRCFSFSGLFTDSGSPLKLPDHHLLSTLRDLSLCGDTCRASLLNRVHHPDETSSHWVRRSANFSNRASDVALYAVKFFDLLVLRVELVKERLDGIGDSRLDNISVNALSLKQLHPEQECREQQP